MGAHGCRLFALWCFVMGIAMGLWLGNILFCTPTTTIQKAEKADRRPS